MSERYERQQRLSEVGASGQHAIEHSAARISAGPHAGIALSYLVRAGVGRVSIARGLAQAFDHRSQFCFSGPLAVAEGAHAALVHLRSALSLT
ncbi:MAG TPA: hypothetical protein VER33_27740 [Polyangiaceae bacterium]|nr:hypothetical protein [Polyangiaceae bacterium]